ncbi:AAA family ATPase [Kocuria rosea]|uniref:OLD family endonuclease n=1 Tax=Kocuria rosea TaxID=1275 RepID=A0A4R5YP83_KOCRO|nr:AAA family ATPase [Kocuria rosea]TDL46492.1 OLD family endonuclease [Kocuria rosea]
MRIEAARVSNFRCVVDSDRFEVEPDKSILVGVNEAGKTALLKALQHASPTEDVKNIDWLFDAPAAMVDDIRRGNLEPAELAVAKVVMRPEPKDLVGLNLADGAEDIRLEMTAWLNNKRTYQVTGLPDAPTIDDAEKAILRLTGAMGKQSDQEAKQVAKALAGWKEAQPVETRIEGDVAINLKKHLDAALPLFAEGSAAEGHWDTLNSIIKRASARDKVGKHLVDQMPPFVYYSSYFSVRPRIHLDRLAEREQSGEIDMDYDFGNLQLLKFLGFTAQELSDMASEAPEKGYNYDKDVNVQKRYQEELAAHERRVTERKRALQTAGARLTEEIRKVWNDKSLTLRLDVDGQYLQTLVEDELGIPVELDQRSEGFRWLVSFFVVFHAQAKDNLRDAVLLLDEPGLSLHALKQQEFRKTVSRLAEGNQILYTTHSPFMIGSDELDLVRIVEMTERKIGTKVHTRLAVDDPRSIYPLQAALGYDLAQSMFTHQKNLVVEGVTDLLYLEALNKAFAAQGGDVLAEEVAIVPAGSASKVVYYSTILTSQNLRVAALLDSDAAGDKATEQDALWQLLSNKRILRTGDHISTVQRAEIEDLVRMTLATVAKDELGWDSVDTLTAQPQRPIMEILSAEHSGVSKWKLARAFARWLSSNGAEALAVDEKRAWSSLTKAAKKALT